MDYLLRLFYACFGLPLQLSSGYDNLPLFSYLTRTNDNL